MSFDRDDDSKSKDFLMRFVSASEMIKKITTSVLLFLFEYKILLVIAMLPQPVSSRALLSAFVLEHHKSCKRLV